MKMKTNKTVDELEDEGNANGSTVEDPGSLEGRPLINMSTPRGTGCVVPPTDPREWARGESRRSERGPLMDRLFAVVPAAR